MARTVPSTQPWARNMIVDTPHAIDAIGKAIARTPTAANWINVFHIRTSLVIGGVETVLSDWSNHSTAAGFKSHLLCFANADGSEGSFVQYLRERGQTATLLPWGRLKRLRSAVSALISCMRSVSGPVVIHSHDVRARLVALVAARLTGTPHVASMHAWHDVAGKVRFLERADAYLLRGADVVVNCSEATRQGSLARGLDPRRNVTIYNGLDFTLFRKPVDRLVWRARYGLKPDEFVVGNVARLYPEKGQIHLLEAAAMLKPEIPNLKVLIIGDGPERGALEAARTRLGLDHIVLMPGFEKNFPEALSMFDVFALPSLAEGAPQVIIGAMARGLPIVACPVDGVAEALEQEHSALLVKPRDPRGMAKAIARLARDPALRCHLAVNALGDGAERFAIQSSMEKLASVYCRLFSDRERVND